MTNTKKRTAKEEVEKIIGEETPQTPKEIEKGNEKKDVGEQLVTLTNDQLKKLIEDIKELKKTNNVLLQVADKRALSNYQQRNKGEIIYDIKIRALEVDGEQRIIVAWKTEKDRVYKDSDLRWKEEQTVKLFFLDGTTKILSLYDFNQRFTYINCKKIGEVRDSVSGEVVFKLLRDDNGEEIEISAPYVN